MFDLVSKFKPSGDQPKAIEALGAGIKNGKKEKKGLYGIIFLLSALIIKKHKKKLLI